MTTMDPEEFERTLAPILANAFDGSTEGIAIFTADDWPYGSRIVYVNDAFARSSGYAKDALVGHSSLLLAGSRPDLDHVRDTMERFDRLPFVTSTKKHRPDGSTYDVDLKIVAIRNHEGVTTHCMLVQHDKIADPSIHVDAEAKRLVEERWLTTAQMAAGIAYEIEPKLAASAMSVRTALEDVEFVEGAASRASTALRDALATTKEIAESVRGLASFARADDRALRLVDVHEAIELAIELTAREIAPSASLVRRYSNVPRVRASLPALARAIVPLLRNAAEAIPPTMPTANSIIVQTEIDHDGNVAIVVRDTGVGIESRDLSHVFEPFFTTKSNTRAKGLGLAIAFSTATDLGGTLTAESVYGRGSTFRLVFPADTDRTRDSLPISIDERLPPRRILAVGSTLNAAEHLGATFQDDEALARITYATLDDAIERLALGETFDLIACDADPAVADVFRARIRRLAPEMLDRTYVIQREHRSGLYSRVDINEQRAANDR
jgi:PAS domain S-box-containing protein